MKAPTRWLEAGSDAPRGAADLLSAAGAVPEFTEALRNRLAVGVARTAMLPVVSPWKALVAKGAFVVGLGGASGYVVHAVAGAHVAPAPVSAPAAAAPAAPAAVSAAPVVAVEALPALQLPTAPPPAPKLKLDPRLEEAELLEKARALVGSNPAAALKLTSDYARDYPRGRLGAEADLIAAQSLLGMGKVAAAKQRAEASLKRYPTGLYARQLREIAAK